MAFATAYKLNINFQVNDAENAAAPFKDNFARNLTIARSGALPGGGVPGFIEIGTGDEVIYSTGDLTALGIMVIENIDPTNYFDIGPDSGGAIVPFIRVLPGESYAFRLTPGIIVRGQANTAACRALAKIYEA